MSTRIFKIEVTEINHVGESIPIVQTEIPIPPESYNVGNNPRKMIGFMIHLFQLLVCKGFDYQDSWKKRGELRGVVANIDRKDDRLNAAIETDQDRNKCDAAIDGAMYRILYIFDFIRKKSPAVFQDWFSSEVLGYNKAGSARIVGSDASLRETPVTKTSAS